jgi:hypothetical protein
MMIVPRSMTSTALKCGVYPHYQVSGFHLDPCKEGDEIEDVTGNYYLIETIQPHYFGDSLVYYESNLHKLNIHFDRYGIYGELTDPQDPRYRTKVWLDNYLNPDAIDDSLTVMWELPEFPLNILMGHTGDTFAVIFCVGKPISTPLLGFKHTPYGYDETVPITIIAVDRTDVMGDKLLWQAESELRRIHEENPIGDGTARAFIDSPPRTQKIGGLIIYSVECRLQYLRGTD